MKRSSWICLVGLTGLLAIVGLLTIHSGVVAVAEESSQTQSETAPAVPSRVPSAEQRTLVAGNTEFALDLYRILRQEEGNLFFSPYSISLALAMVYTGSYGKTEEQMASALHFEFAPYDLPPVFGALHSELVGRGNRNFQLRLANSLWWQEGYAFRRVFLDTLKAHYGALPKHVDFAGAPAKSRATINEWVSRYSKGKIKELLPQGSITSLTRLILANAITFRATWKERFNADFTYDSPFYLLDDRQVTVPMMHQITPFAYTATGGVQAVELPYIGEQFSMVVLLPAPDQFEAFAALLTATRVASILAQLDTQLVQVYRPRFEFGSSLELSSALRALGMRRAFVLGTADFTGMADTRELFLDEIHHQTLVSVDEIGTFAVVATSPGLVGPDVPAMRLNRPFIFLIRDIGTNSILFIGQVLDPSEG